MIVDVQDSRYFAQRTIEEIKMAIGEGMTPSRLMTAIRLLALAIATQELSSQRKVMPEVGGSLIVDAVGQMKDARKMLAAVLCAPDGTVAMYGGDGDRRCIEQALKLLEV